MDIFQILFYAPIFNLLIGFYHLFGGNIGLAILAVAFASKLITAPLTDRQIKNAEKSKAFQAEIEKIREKYKHNEEKLAKEMAKIQAQFLPGQLGGCLSIIIFIILFVQIRMVIINIFNQGFHAYNEVAYFQEWKRKEDSIKYKSEAPLTEGLHKMEITIKGENGAELKKIYEFYITSNREKTIEEIRQSERAKSDNQKSLERTTAEKLLQEERGKDLSIYSILFDEKSHVSVPVNQILFIALESKSALITDQNQSEFTFFLRPPGNSALDASATKIVVDGVDVTTKAQISYGEKVNLNFLGMNLARVASDFPLEQFYQMLPYLLVGLLVGITQYFSTQAYLGANPAITTAAPEAKSKDDSKKKKDEPEPDFAQVMAESSKQMNYIFPVMTAAMSWGYLGGAALFPTGVSLFWTGQNLFVIIQQLLLDPKKSKKQIIDFWVKVQSKINNIKSDKNGRRK